MSWFKSVVSDLGLKHLNNQGQPSHLRIAQLTDCHLLVAPGRYEGVDSLANLHRVLAQIKAQNYDLVVVTGDITQDHTLASYQLLAQACEHYLPQTMVVWLPGNHDDIDDLHTTLSNEPMNPAKHVSLGNWHILMLNTKGPTPSGVVCEQHLNQIEKRLDGIKPQQHVLAFCHHHPLPVNGYIDKHILQNGEQLLVLLAKYPQVKCLAHGHVHQARVTAINSDGLPTPVEKPQCQTGFTLLATPATSIQFKVNSLLKANDHGGPAFRDFKLFDDGTFETAVVWLDDPKTTVGNTRNN
jgi:Icc protein